jgi:hypothetical protein
VATMDLEFCPMCGERRIVEAQQYCGRCGSQLDPLDSRKTHAALTPGRLLQDRAAREPDYARRGDDDVAETSPGWEAIVEFALGLVGLVVFAFPFVTVSQAQSGRSASASLLDALSRGTWSSEFEVVLIVIGSGAATALAAARLGRRPLVPATLPLIGFVAAALGYVWLLLAWNGAMSQISSLVSYLGVNVEPGIGIFLGLLMVVAGAGVCLLDTAGVDLFSKPAEDTEPPLEMPGLEVIGRWIVRESNLDKVPIKTVVHLAYDDAHLVLARRSPEVSVVVLDQPTFERCDEMFIRVRNGQGAELSLDWVEGPKAREIEKRLRSAGVL